MHRRLVSLPILGLVFGLLCHGCGAVATQSAVHTFARIMETGMPAYARETDLALAEPALAATLKLLEALLETDPHNPTLLVQAAQGFASYTYAFVETPLEAARGQDLQQVAVSTQRAQRLYQRGLHYGLRRLSLYHPAWGQATTLDLEALEGLLRQLNTTAVPALFWTTFCWSNLLNLERAAPETAAALPRLAALLVRLLELDDTYFYGAPHLLQAVYYASRPPLLGGDPQRAQQHFARAQTLSQGRLLLIPLLEAQYYAVQTQDRALCTRLLQQILEAPDTLFPEQALLNAVARQRAALLLRRLDELFT